MTGTEIIAKFNLQVDDSSELSSTETLDLLNDVYTDVQNERPWEWLKSTYTGTTSTSVPYIALPSDFKLVAPNKENKSVIFVGTDYAEYIVIPFAERRNHRDQDGYCYVDIPNQRLYFTLQPTSAKAVEFDYIKVAAALTLATSPLFREGFHKVLAFGMAAKFPALEQSNKATSYGSENATTYGQLIIDMALEDAETKLAYV